MSEIKSKQVLENFLSEMKIWEIKWGKILENDPSQIFTKDGMKARLDELILIQNKYLSKKALSLKQDRLTTLSFGLPPEYDQIISAENQINDKKIEYYTKNSKNKDCRIYTLILENGLWKVDLMKIDALDWKSSRQVF